MMLNKYNQGDLIPLTLNVLQIAYSSYACIGFKVLVKCNYPDLQGMIETDRLDDVSVELLNSTPEGAMVIIHQSLEAIIDATMSLANIYGIPYDTLENDPRIDELANEFYLHLVIDSFPVDGSKKKVSRKSFQNLLSTYAISLVTLVGGLCTVIKAGQIDFEKVYDEDETTYDFLVEDYTEEKHGLALDLLQELAGTLLTHYEELPEAG